MRLHVLTFFLLVAFPLVHAGPSENDHDDKAAKGAGWIAGQLRTGAMPNMNDLRRLREAVHPQTAQQQGTAPQTGGQQGTSIVPTAQGPSPQRGPVPQRTHGQDTGHAPALPPNTQQTGQTTRPQGAVPAPQQHQMSQHTAPQHAVPRQHLEPRQHTPPQQHATAQQRMAIRIGQGVGSRHLQIGQGAGARHIHVTQRQPSSSGSDRSLA